MLSVQPVVIHYCDLSEHTLPDLALQIYRSEPLLPSECHLSASSILYQVILLPSKQRQTIISYNKHTQKHPLHNSVYTLHKCNSTTIIYLKPLHAVNEFLPLQNCCKVFYAIDMTIFTCLKRVRRSTLFSDYLKPQEIRKS